MSHTAAVENEFPALADVLSDALPIRRRVIALRTLADVRTRPIAVNPELQGRFAARTLEILPKLGTYIPDPLMVTNRLISEHIYGRIAYDLGQFQTLCRYHVTYANRSAPRHLRTALRESPETDVDVFMRTAAPSP